MLEVDGSKCRRSSGLTLEYCRVVYQKIREVIVVQLDAAFPESGFFEVDGSYFGDIRKGKRGRGAAGKVPVFGILTRGGQGTYKSLAL